MVATPGAAEVLIRRPHQPLRVSIEPGAWRDASATPRVGQEAHAYDEDAEDTEIPDDTTDVVGAAEEFGQDDTVVRASPLGPPARACGDHFEDADATVMRASPLGASSRSLVHPPISCAAPGTPEPAPRPPAEPRALSGGVRLVLTASAFLGAILGAVTGGGLVAVLMAAGHPTHRPDPASAAISDVLLPVTYDFSSLRFDMLAAQYEVGVTSPFGPRLHPVLQQHAHHSGVDIDMRKGEIISAGAPGVVVVASWRGDYGRMVEIDHGEGVKTRYAHCDTLLVKAGDEVQVGDPLGTVGATGRATGPHLHFEVRVDNRPVDPQLETWREFFPIRGDEWSEEGVARRLQAADRPSL